MTAPLIQQIPVSLTLSPEEPGVASEECLLRATTTWVHTVTTARVKKRRPSKSRVWKGDKCAAAIRSQMYLRSLPHGWVLDGVLTL
jgi:hypothetical protein